jgi:hypothetical protein
LLEGVLMAFAAIALTVASTLMSAAGQASQGKSAQAIAEFNAQQRELEAKQTRDAAQFEETRQRERAARLMGAQRAAYGGSGVTLEGTPLIVQADTAEEAELDALAIRYSGSVAEARSRAAAAAERMQGKAMRQAGYFGAGTTLLQGGAKAFSMGFPASGQAGKAG